MPRSTPTISSSRAPGSAPRSARPTRTRASLALDLDPAFDWSTVIVVTAADIPGDNIVSSIKADQPILVPVGGEIQHHAEPLALIAAPDRATLRAARHAVAVRTETLPPVFDPEASDHQFAAYEMAVGDPDAAFAAADLILEGEYRVGHQEQLYIENNAMIAVPSGDGGVTVHGSLQCPYYVHTALKKRARDGRPPGARRPGRDRRRVRRQGGVPVDDRAARGAPRGQGSAPGADDLRPSRGPRRDDQAPPGDRPPPDRGDPRRPAASPRTSRS